MNRYRPLLFSLITALSLAGGMGAEDRRPSADDVARVDGLPAVGKWMLTAKGAPADWLGQKFRGETLYEPVNVIVIDRYAASPEDAKQRMYRAAKKAGFPVHFGHSGGYQGRIGEALYAQLPEKGRCAFADGKFELNNSHGRVFGPHREDTAYYFTAAFSYEKVVPVHKEIHRFGSFKKARDRFARGLVERAGYTLAYYVSLDNAILFDRRLSTGDHDGLAAVLEAGKD